MIERIFGAYDMVIFIEDLVAIDVFRRSFCNNRALSFLSRQFRKNLIPKEIGGMVLPSNLVHPLVPDDFVVVLMVRVSESRPVVIVDFPIKNGRF